jgi:60 kDa SS-A/Ro ribonucleoprotein
MTGCFNPTAYRGAKDDVGRVLKLAMDVEAEYVAKLAIYAREEGLMKDVPAVLCAVLAVRDGEMLEKVFPRVIDTGKMLRNFVQVVRSGVTGRKSLGSRPKRLVRQWLEKRSDEGLFFDSVGTSPSMADVIRMVHPRPATEARKALYAYLVEQPFEREQLPGIVREYLVLKDALKKAG